MKILHSIFECFLANVQKHVRFLRRRRILTLKTIIILKLLAVFLYLVYNAKLRQGLINRIAFEDDYENEDKNRLEQQPQALNFSGPTNDRQIKVVEAFKHSWNAYKNHAWGQDELLPLSQSSTNWMGLSLTMIDSLDTMYIMNLMHEFDECKQWIVANYQLDSDYFGSLFEITIRVMGGLLSSYHLSGEKKFLHIAHELGNRSLPAFNTLSSIPSPYINLKRREAKSRWTYDNTMAGAGTLQIEYKDLSRLTGDRRFRQIANKISRQIHKLSKYYGLVPVRINTLIGMFYGRRITMGGQVDSYYEYLLKQWIQTGASVDENDPNFYLLEDWMEAVGGMKKKLIGRTKKSNLTFVGELENEKFIAKMEHLTCFLPGNLALGYFHLNKRHQLRYGREEIDELLTLAEQITETCYQMYAQTATGLSPEIVYMNTVDANGRDFEVNKTDRYYILRPETIESLYYLYKVTKNVKYQEYGWRIFESFEKHARYAPGGYASVYDVTETDQVRHMNSMESFFLAETLKYFYLLFEDNENIDWRKWLFNTEAHLISIFV